MRKADNLSPYCAVVKNSRSLNFLDPSGPAWPVNGSSLPLLYHRVTTELPLVVGVVIHKTSFYKTVCYTLPHEKIGCEIHHTKSITQKPVDL